MWENFLFGLNAVLPICLILLLGRLLRRLGIGDSFFKTCDRLVFNLFLPLLLFQSVANSRLSSADGGLFAFALTAMILTVVLPWVITPLFVRDNARRGAFIQGVFRSNVAILGLPLAELLFGAEGRARYAVFTAAALFVINSASVVVLAVFAPRSEEKPSAGKVVKDVLLSIVKNPLVIAIVLGLPFMLIDAVKLPVFLDTTVEYLAGLATPLALLSLGASVHFTDDRSRLKLAVIASVLKSFLIPAAVTAAALLMGFRGVNLGVIFLLFAVPSAVASYVHAQNMKSDALLAGQIIVLTTVMSLVSVFLGMFLMRSFGLL